MNQVDVIEEVIDPLDIKVELSSTVDALEG